MTLQHLVNWLREQTDVGDGIAVSAIEEQKERYIGVYASSTGARQRVCIGGKKQTKYAQMDARILIHWTVSPVEAEKKAREVYGLFYGLSGVEMDGVPVIMADPGARAEWAGRSKNSVCEYVIRLKLTYERTEDNG